MLIPCHRFHFDRLLKAFKRAKPWVIALPQQKLIQPRRAQIVPSSEGLLSQVSIFQGITNGSSNIM
jgi:hypothetical protein